MDVTDAVRSLIAESTDEKTFMQWIRTFAEFHGWKVYHTYDSRRSPSGFPDLFMVRGDRAVAIEVKGPHGRVMPDQREWHDALRASGIDVFVFWPRDEREVRDLLR